MKKLTKDILEKNLDFAVSQIRANLQQWGNDFESAYSTQGFYDPADNTEWTNGFWTGQVWLAYQYTKDEFFKKCAMNHVHSFLHRIENKICVDHHDMGFLYSPSCVAGYLLTGDETAKKAALLAAEQLASRFQKNGGFIRAWGEMNNPEHNRLIIDCLLNVPLLFFATKETNNSYYEEIARTHIDTALQCVIREDGSTWHTYYFDLETGKPSRGATCQGYKDGSAWARGQAWGIYGTALAYTHTKNTKYIETFYKVTDFFLEGLPEDSVPYWDFTFKSGDEPRDSSAALIAVCGILEILPHLPVNMQSIYETHAFQILESILNSYVVTDKKTSNGLVLHATYSKHSPYNTCNHYGVDECNNWGDYFYMEALIRLYGEWKGFW